MSEISRGTPDGPPVDDEAASPGRGRQIVLIFLAIGVITIAFMQLHTLIPGMDQFVAVTPVVLIAIVGVTILLLYRLSRPR